MSEPVRQSPVLETRNQRSRKRRLSRLHLMSEAVDPAAFKRPLIKRSLTSAFRRHAARGSGIPQIIAAKRDPANATDELASGRTAAVKAVLTAAALAVGGSVGREGPTVQLGATIMAYAHKLLRVPVNASVLVAGAAAGVAAAFNTPLAGVAFAIEELAAAYEQRTTLLVMTAVLIAGMIAQGVAGDYVYFGLTAESLALVGSAEEHFRPLVQAALLTGARWSELYRMTVRDVDLHPGTVLFPETKGGRPRHVHLSDEGIAFFRAQCRAKGLTASVFLNNAGEPFGPSHQIRMMRETCVVAEVEHAGFHILRHTYGSRLAMAGVPMAVIAEALGHADERITRKHYAHLAPSYVRDAVRAGLGSMGIFKEQKFQVVA